MTHPLFSVDCGYSDRYRRINCRYGTMYGMMGLWSDYGNAYLSHDLEVRVGSGCFFLLNKSKFACQYGKIRN